MVHEQWRHAPWRHRTLGADKEYVHVRLRGSRARVCRKGKMFRRVDLAAGVDHTDRDVGLVGGEARQIGLRADDGEGALVDRRASLMYSYAAINFSRDTLRRGSGCPADAYGARPVRGLSLVGNELQNPPIAAAPCSFATWASGMAPRAPRTSAALSGRPSRVSPLPPGIAQRSRNLRHAIRRRGLQASPRRSRRPSRAPGCDRTRRRGSRAGRDFARGSAASMMKPAEVAASRTSAAEASDGERSSSLRPGASRISVAPSVEAVSTRSTAFRRGCGQRGGRSRWRNDRP